MTFEIDSEDARVRAVMRGAEVYSTPVMWAFGRSLAREIVMEPGPQPMSRILGDVGRDERYVRRCGRLFWAVLQL